jgi:hypothetical protein
MMENSVDWVIKCTLMAIVMLVCSKKELSVVMALIIGLITIKYTLENGLEGYLMEKVCILGKINIKDLFQMA